MNITFTVILILLLWQNNCHKVAQDHIVGMKFSEIAESFLLQSLQNIHWLIIKSLFSSGR